MISERVVHPHSLVDANSQHLTATPAFNDEIMILSSSSSSPEKNFSSSIVQRQRIESSDSDEETRKEVNKDGSLSTLNVIKEKGECKIGIGSSTSSTGKDPSSLTIECAGTTSGSEEENVLKSEGGGPMKVKKDEGVDIPNWRTKREITPASSMESSTVKPIIRRRKITSSGSDSEDSKVTDTKSIMAREKEASEVKQKNKCEIAPDSTVANGRRKSALRYRHIASSSSEEETGKGAGDESMEMKCGDDEVETDKSKRKRRRSMKHRLRRRRRSSSASSSSSISTHSILSDHHAGELDGIKKERRGRNKKELEGKAIGDAHEEGKEVEEGDDFDDKDGKKGRKKIRKILKDKKLSSETKNAEALERERRKRLEERQRLVGPEYLFGIEIGDEYPFISVELSNSYPFAGNEGRMHHHLS